MLRLQHIIRPSQKAPQLCYETVCDSYASSEARYPSPTFISYHSPSFSHTRVTTRWTIRIKFHPSSKRLFPLNPLNNLWVGILGEAIKCMNSTTWFAISIASCGFSLFLWKTTLFLLFQIFQAAKGKRIFHGGFVMAIVDVWFPFQRSQSSSSLFQNIWFASVIPNWVHTGLT